MARTAFCLAMAHRTLEIMPSLLSLTTLVGKGGSTMEIRKTSSSRLPPAAEEPSCGCAPGVGKPTRRLIRALVKDYHEGRPHDAPSFPGNTFEERNPSALESPHLSV